MWNREETYVNQREVVEKTFLIDANGKYKTYTLLWFFNIIKWKAQFKCLHIMTPQLTIKYNQMKILCYNCHKDKQLFILREKQVCWHLWDKNSNFLF